MYRGGEYLTVKFENRTDSYKFQRWCFSKGIRWLSNIRDNISIDNYVLTINFSVRICNGSSKYMCISFEHYNDIPAQTVETAKLKTLLLLKKYK